MSYMVTWVWPIQYVNIRACAGTSVLDVNFDNSRSEKSAYVVEVGLSRWWGVAEARWNFNTGDPGTEPSLYHHPLYISAGRCKGVSISDLIWVETYKQLSTHIRLRGSLQFISVTDLEREAWLPWCHLVRLKFFPTFSSLTRLLYTDDVQYPAANVFWLNVERHLRAMKWAGPHVELFLRDGENNSASLLYFWHTSCTLGAHVPVAGGIAHELTKFTAREHTKPSPNMWAPKSKNQWLFAQFIRDWLHPKTIL